jgi:hypothetical protein
MSFLRYLCLLMYTTTSGKRLGSDRGKKTPTYKVKDPLSFEIWIFRNDQPDCDTILDSVIICISSIQMRWKLRILLILKNLFLFP